MTEQPERPRRAKGEPMAAYTKRREGYVAMHRELRSGSRKRLAQLEDAVGWLVQPGAFDDELPTPIDPVALDTATDAALASDEAKPAEQELFSNHDPEKDALRAELEELRNRPPVVIEKIVEVEKIVHVEVAAVEGEAEAPYVPDFTIVPDELAKYAEADESAEDFRKRAFALLFRFGINDGEHFEGAMPLTPEERIKLVPMLVANFKAGNWLKLTEELNPQA